MPIPLIAAGIGLAASAIAGAIGRAVSAGKEAEAKRLYDEAVADYGDEILPHLNKSLEGKLPESAFKNIAQGEGRRGMREVYGQLQDVYKNEGMTDADRAAMQLAKNEVSSRSAQKTAELRQMLAARGGAQSPGMLAMLASEAGQQEVNALGNMAAQNQIAARQRALQALGQAGGMAQGMGEQDANAAGAMDRLNMFNFDKRMSLKQQDFLNTMAQRDARNAAKSRQAEYYMRQGEADRQTAAGIGSAFSTLGGAAANYLGDQEKMDRIYGRKP